MGRLMDDTERQRRLELARVLDEGELNTPKFGACLKLIIYSHSRFISPSRRLFNAPPKRLDRRQRVELSASQRLWSAWTGLNSTQIIIPMIINYNELHMFARPYLPSRGSFAAALQQKER